MKILKRRRKYNKNYKTVIIFTLFLISFLSIGYAAFQTNIVLKTRGTLKIPEGCINGNVWEFSQKDEAQEFKVPCSGTYKVELWGASGGSGSADGSNYVYPGGNGAYVSGNTFIKKNNKLFLYIGGKGADARYDDEHISNGGYNGGGTGGYDERVDTTSDAAGGGGGATDVRLYKTDNFSDFLSLKTRVMVAAGAGGGVWFHRSIIDGQNGGGLYVKDLNIGAHSTTLSKVLDGTQKSGFKFGVGVDNGQAPGSGPGHSGGGGGYYSGIGNVQGPGGTSFISGHEGCDAISESSTEDNIIHTGQSIHYSKMYFTETVMIDGAGCKWTTEKTTDCLGMPTHDGNGTMTGNEGDGFAKITLISRK